MRFKLIVALVEDELSDQILLQLEMLGHWRHCHQ